MCECCYTEAVPAELVARVVDRMEAVVDRTRGFESDPGSSPRH
jgi:hypothetical protein